jgi:hypothetical protein
MKQATRSTSSIPRSQGIPLPVPARDRLLALIGRMGEAAVLKKLRIARQTLARCAAGLPVQRATAECVSRRLAEIGARTKEAHDAP